MSTIYKPMKPEPVRLLDPETRKLRTGVAVAYCKGRMPTWFKVRFDRDALPRPGVYNVDTCRIEFVKPPSSRPQALPTYADPCVIAPACPEVPTWTRADPIHRGGTEFFAGSGRLSDTLESTTRVGPMIRVDFEASPPDEFHWAVDIGALIGAQLKRLASYQYIHGSPQCSTYCNLAISVHGRTWDTSYMGVSEAAFRANGLNLRLFLTLRNRQLQSAVPALITIENPEATFHLSPLGQHMCRPLAEGGLGLTLIRFTFCAFDEPWRKPTILLTNVPTLIRLFEHDRFYCRQAHNNGLCDFQRRKHTPITVRNGNDGVDTDVVTPFPLMLCSMIAQSVARDLGETRCNTTDCAFGGGHCGPCSGSFAPRRRGLKRAQAPA